MSIKCDYHLHSSFSADSDTPMEEMINKGIGLGLDEMCFTEHNDFNFPDNAETKGADFILNTDSYLYELLRMREKYEGQIKLLYGAEVGLNLETFRENAVFVKNNEFDFVIGSVHLINGLDPYYPSFFEGKTDAECYMLYFETVLKNIVKFSNFDVLGHLDYIIRYGKTKDSEYSYSKYFDIIDRILLNLIENGKGIELNMGGLFDGLKNPNPNADILKRYRELGGEIITVGSDSHSCDIIAYRFDLAEDILKACGFKYITKFEKRTPEFLKI